MFGQGGCLLPDGGGVPTCWVNPPVASFVPGDGRLRFLSISGSGQTTCGIASDSAAYCWGVNAYGELGDGTRTRRDQTNSAGLTIRTPTPVATPLKFVAVAVGNVFVCALTVRGQAYCWGWNGDGNVGTGVKEDRYYTTPVAINSSERFKELSAGATACGRTVNDLTLCWGSLMGSYDVNIYVEPGDCSDRFYFWYQGRACLLPTPLPDRPALQSISRASCGLLPDRSALCWGRNYYGELGNGTMTPYAVNPTVVAGGHSFQKIEAGVVHACGLSVEGRVYCWGWNGAAQLGIGHSSMSSAIVPSPIASPLSFVDLDVDTASCALTASGEVWCWGLGYGASPVEIII